MSGLLTPAALQEPARPVADAILEADYRDWIMLLKPRVLTLVVYSGVIGLIVAPGRLHPVLALTAVLCITVAAGACGAINMWYDRDIDAIMRRTSRRSIPAGRIEPGAALGFGIVLAVGSVLVMGLAVNIPAAAVLALSIGFYVFIYTMWLKRRTPQNIVIGGAAGAFPPMIGWAAVTGTVSLESILLFLIIFMWTPPHFWALALLRSRDYERVGVPMLPVVAGPAETRRQILLYSIALVPLGILPSVIGIGGISYAVASTVLGAIFLWFAIDVWRITEGREADKACKRLFWFSILYLYALFAILVVEGAMNRLMA